MTLQEFGDELLGMALGRLKMGMQEALSMDVNLLRLALWHHESDLLKINGIWPEAPKRKPSVDDFRSFAKKHNSLRAAGKLRPATKR